MIAELTGNFTINVLNRISEGVDYLLLFVKNDLKLRKQQAENSPLAAGFQQETATDTAITSFAQAQSGAMRFSYIEVLIEDTASACRYTLDASAPTAGGRGHKVPAGGSALTIPGAENVKNFKLICETGGTAPLTIQGFQ